MRHHLITVLCLLLAVSVHAADDPTIPAQLKTDVQVAMNAHIDSNQSGGRFVIYDAVDGKLLRLQLKELHAGVVRNGEFYVSCADFADEIGAVVDVDFLVVRSDYGFRVLEGVVHKVGGKKRTYNLEENTHE